MQNPITESERQQLEDKINAACGRAAIRHPLPEMFLKGEPISPAAQALLKNGNPASVAVAEFLIDAVAMQCPCQPYVDWAVFAWNDERAHLLHRFRLN